VQDQAFAVLTAGREKSVEVKVTGKGRSLQPTGVFTQGHHGDFAFHLAGQARFQLFGHVRDTGFRYRHTGRCITQGLAFDQLPV